MQYDQVSLFDGSALYRLYRGKKWIEAEFDAQTTEAIFALSDGAELEIKNAGTPYVFEIMRRDFKRQKIWLRAKKGNYGETRRKAKD